MHARLEATPLPAAPTGAASARRSALIKAALLLGLSAYFAWNMISGNLQNYINLRFAWLSAIAVVLFLLLGLYCLALAWRPGRPLEVRGDPAHTPPSAFAIGVIAVPLLLGTLVPSQPLGADAVGSIDVNPASAGANAANVSVFARSPLERNILDWLRVFNQAGDYATLEGEPADVTGFFYIEPGFAEDQFMIARFTISCCVADAGAIGLPVQWADAPGIAQGQWLRVQGTIRVGEFRGETTPILIASSVTPVDVPQNPYLYP